MPGDAEPIRGSWKDTAVVGAVLAVAYALLVTPDWVPGGDSEFLAAVARSLARGEGYVYNGQPVRLVPPGWPWLLAGVFWLSPTFLAGKLVNLICMAVAGVLSHRVLLRLVPPRVAMLSALAAGLLATAYPLTIWLHSDPLFVLLGWVAALAALRILEARTPRRSMAWAGLLVVAVALLPTVRYAAVFQWGIPTALLMSALLPWRRAPNARPALVAFVLGTAATLGVFFGTVRGLSHYEVAYEARRGTPVVPETPGLTDAEHELPDVLNNGPASRRPFLVDRGLRLLGGGQWPAWVLWYPARFASGVPGANVVVILVGFACLGLIVLAGLHAVRGRGAFPRSRWVWLAVVAYTLMLAFVWPLPNARYLVPIAPLVIAGVIQGCAVLGEQAARPKLARALAAAFLFSLFLVNGLLYGIDLYVQRFAPGYGVYEAGRLVSLVDALELLKKANVLDGELAVSERYDNLGRMRFLKSGTREVVLLLDRQVVTVPDVYSFEPGQIPQKSFENGLVLPGGFAEWAQKRGVQFYLYQRPPYPWRLWHFKLPPWLHASLGGPPDPGVPDGWVLYAAENNWSAPITVPHSRVRLTRVPGLE